VISWFDGASTRRAARPLVKELEKRHGRRSRRPRGALDEDVPAELPPGFTLAAITAREDHATRSSPNRYRTLADMPPGAVVGIQPAARRRRK